MPADKLDIKSPASTQLTPTTRVRRPGGLRLRILEPESKDFEIDKPYAVVGRAEESGISKPDIPIGHPTISKLHFSLRVCDDGVLVEDLNSKNGLWFAQRRVDKVILAPGDTFRAGSCTFELVGVDEVSVEVSQSDRCGSLFGRSTSMREVFALLAKVAKTPLGVLVLGETGTGKELAARTIHELSSRADKPFRVLDCSCMPATLADAVMFGTSRGAYTGSERNQPGLFEQAHTGTLFLDELGELPLELQAKLLRVLDTSQVSRLGEPGNLRQVDVRLIAATNRDLAAEVDEGRFRADLYYRVRHTIVRLPPLRERGRDVVLLAREFLAEIEEQHGHQVELSPEAESLLVLHGWPGNVRELRNLVRAAALMSDGVIRADDLQFDQAPQWTHQLVGALFAGDRSYEEFHDLVDTFLLPRVLQEAGSMRQASAQLGIGRNRLRSRLEKLGLRDYDPSRDTSKDSSRDSSGDSK